MFIWQVSGYDGPNIQATFDSSFETIVTLSKYESIGVSLIQLCGPKCVEFLVHYLNNLMCTHSFLSSAYWIVAKLKALACCSLLDLLHICSHYTGWELTVEWIKISLFQCLVLQLFLRCSVSRLRAICPCVTFGPSLYRYFSLVFM